MAKILDIRLDRVTMPQALAKIQAFLLDNTLHHIATVNPEFIMAARRDKKFKEILNSTDLNVPDGFGLQCAAWFLGEKIGERITGVDLTWEICKIAAEKGYSVYFLGAAGGVAEKAAYRIKLLNSSLNIAGVSSGNPEDEGLIDSINNTKPDILFVAYGAPKQEKFIFDHKDQLKVKIAIGIGGTFDYIAGIVPYAPLWVRKLGLEWFYRALTQPRRLKRILTAVFVFPLVVFTKRIGEAFK